MLDPWLVTGFTDGEGSFSLYVRRDKQKRLNHVAIYYRWQVDFGITLRGDDFEFLQKVEAYFNCGNCSIFKINAAKNELGFCTYHITSPMELEQKVVPHFEKFPLQSKKARDFVLWREAVSIIRTAKERKRSIADKVVYSNEENERLVNILDSLKFRLTGGHITQKRVDYKLQGTKNII